MTVQEAIALGIQHHAAGRLAEAESIYRQILAHDPRQSDAINLLGVIASQVNKPEVAADLLQQAIAINSNVPDYHNNFGLVLTTLRQGERAVDELRTAIRLKPNYPEAWYNLGNALRTIGQLDLAIDAYRKATELRPEYAWAYNNLAHAMMEKRQHAQAVAPLQKAIELIPTEADFHSNLGGAYWAAGRLDESIAAYRRALELRPDAADFHSNLGNALKDQGKLIEATQAFQRSVELSPQSPLLHSNLIYILHFHPHYDAAALFREHRKWNERHALPLTSVHRPHPNDRSPERRLRIGYVSPDFREHAVGRFIAPLLRQHDHQHFQIHCYSDVPHPDAMTQAIEPLADVWRNISDRTDPEIVDIIRQDQIDILVDLAAHGARNRLLVFAAKPAPVQVTYLAYPSTTGLDAIDYRITDPYLDPLDAPQEFYSEESIRLPETYWCYEPAVSSPEPNALPAVANGYITFGCLNTFRKISEQSLLVWCELLRQAPTSRLLLHANEGVHRTRVQDFLKGRGLDPGRLSFVGHVPLADYLKIYQQIDIGLDPFPYTGGTTTCDALYMGVPVVTLAGDRAVFRGGLSLLSNVGLSELIAQREEDYIRIAKDLAGDLSRLGALRQSLRQRMQNSPLMDTPRFARNIESAYRTMWRRWCTAKT